MKRSNFRTIRIITLTITMVLLGVGFAGQLLRSTEIVALAENAPANADNAVLVTATWDGGGADTNWMTAANWVGDVAPVAGADLVFPSGAARRD